MVVEESESSDEQEVFPSVNVTDVIDRNAVIILSQNLKPGAYQETTGLSTTVLLK